MCLNHLLAANVLHWGYFSIANAVMWFLGSWRNIPFPLNSENLAQECLKCHSFSISISWNPVFPCVPFFFISRKFCAIISFLFVLFVGFSNSRALIIFILHRYNRLLIHWWLTSVISLLCSPCPQTISTSEEEKHCIYLCFFRAQNIIGAQWATIELTYTWSCQLDFKPYFERSWERLEVFDGEGSGWHDLT